MAAYRVDSELSDTNHIVAVALMFQDKVRSPSRAYPYQGCRNGDTQLLNKRSVISRRFRVIFVLPDVVPSEAYSRVVS
jgi:hypothetical protein